MGLVSLPAPFYYKGEILMECPVVKRGFQIITVFLLLFLSITLQGEASLRVEPSRFILHVQPGGRDTGAITVRNDSDRPLDLTATFYDWILDDQNELIIFDSGTFDASLEGLIRFNPRQFRLGPGESQVVRFTVEMPREEGEPFERRGIIFFEHEDPFDEEEGIGATIKTMIGTTIYVMPAEYRLSFHIIDALIHTTEDKQRVGALLLGSDALVHSRFTVNYRVLAQGGRVVEEGKTSELVLLPDEVRPLFIPLQEIDEPGNYRMMVEIKFSGIDYQINDSVPFVVE